MRLGKIQEKVSEAIHEIQIYCIRNGCDYAHIIGKRRHWPLVKQRHDLWRHLRSLGFSYPVIAKASNKDHSTVIAGVKYGL